MSSTMISETTTNTTWASNCSNSILLFVGSFCLQKRYYKMGFHQRKIQRNSFRGIFFTKNASSSIWKSKRQASETLQLCPSRELRTFHQFWRDSTIPCRWYFNHEQLPFVGLSGKNYTKEMQSMRDSCCQVGYNFQIINRVIYSLASRNDF